MKKLDLNLFVFALLITVGSFNLVSAQAITASTTTPVDSKVEVSLPIDKSDFLLFYGVTSNDTANSKIVDLRKDFAKKFDVLKTEYEKEFYTTVGDLELSPIASLNKETEDPKPLPKVTAAKSIDSKVATPIAKSATSIAASTAKYIITQTSDNIISPAVNMINNKVSDGVKTEASSWFQKIKSWFGW